MTKEQARQKLFEALDKAYSKYGVDAGMCSPGFFPHFAEVGAETMRPTWYTKWQIDEGTTLLTWYEAVRDICISTLHQADEDPRVVAHNDYPMTMEEAKMILTLFKE